ncbi:glycosyltransferase family 4 protein [Portibacter marinus]|uniref:glycosyltransferase family 4 protein n=1 Tax=Portibacter marinus TaxID=2898660 RepID=UPI001F17D279|nr:glycosyltransferase family 4 protein [Portibacter marinus]
MRILVLNFEYPPIGGGASPVCQKICENLAQRGHAVEVVTMGFEDLPKEEVKNDVRIHRVDVARKQASMSYPMEHLRFLAKARRFLKNYLKRKHFDVVHCHFILSTGILAKYVKKQFDIPYIVTAHGSDLPNYNPDRFQAIHYVTPHFIRGIIKNSFATGAPSHFLGQLIKPYSTGEKSPFMIPNGIDLPDQKQLNKEKIILSTGRLLKRKGFHTLIEAVKDMETDYKIHICGDGPEMESLKKLAEDAIPTIKFHGWLDNTSKQYQELLQKASIYCLVSEFENASISILEGMAHACAVITGNQSGTAEMVGETGVLTTPYDVDQLKNALEQLIENDDRRHKLGEKARQKVNDNYTWDVITDQYEALLTQAYHSRQSC